MYIYHNIQLENNNYEWQTEKCMTKSFFKFNIRKSKHTSILRRITYIFTTMPGINHSICVGACKPCLLAAHTSM